jgi:hypothetical protein
MGRGHVAVRNWAGREAIRSGLSGTKVGRGAALAVGAAEVRDAAVVIEAGVEPNSGNDGGGGDGNASDGFDDVLKSHADPGFAALVELESVGVAINGGTVGEIVILDDGMGLTQSRKSRSMSWRLG